jgi:hypothetical protein
VILAKLEACKYLGTPRQAPVMSQCDAHLRNVRLCFCGSRHFLYLNRDSSVGIATCYRLESLGIESRWEARFSAPIQTGPGAHPGSYTMGTGSFPGVKRPGCGVDHPPPSSAEVKERLKLYLYSTPGPLWPVLEWPHTWVSCFFRTYVSENCFQSEKVSTVSWWSSLCLQGCVTRV